MRSLKRILCASLLFLTGCDAGDPTSIPFRPGAKAVTSALRIDSNRQILNVALHNGKEAIGTLPPGTKLEIVSDPEFARKRKEQYPDRQVQIKVKSGPHKDVVAFVPRSRLVPSK